MKRIINAITNFLASILVYLLWALAIMIILLSCSIVNSAKNGIIAL